MFGFGKKKNTCRNEALGQVLELYNTATELLLIIDGKKEIPEGYEGADVHNSLIETVNQIEPVLTEIKNCEEFLDDEFNYWYGHLNQLGGFSLRKVNDIESAIAFYEASLSGYEALESSVTYPYYDLPNLLNDIHQYTSDGHYCHLDIRRMYTSLISNLGDEIRTEKEVKKNIELARENFKKSPDSFITYAETLWQAGQFYDGETSFDFYKEAMDVIEARADLKTHMENNDLRLLRYKFFLYNVAFDLGKKDLSDTLIKEIGEYKEFFVNATESVLSEEIKKYREFCELALESNISEHINPKGYWSPEKLILKRAAEVHQFRSHLEQTSGEYSYEESLELVTKNLTDIDELIKEVRKNDASTYFVPHLIAFKAYIHARMSDNDSAAKLYKEAQKLCEKYEKENSFEKSDDFQEMIISLTGGHIYDSLICQLGYLTNLQDTKKADKEFLKLVDLAFDKAPNNENGSLITILRKTGERFSFPLRQDEEDNQKAIEVFKKGVELLEQNSSLEESMNNNDLNLLFFKDYLRMNLDYLGEKDEASKLASEIEPYEDYISWRQDFNLSEM